MVFCDIPRSIDCIFLFGPCVIRAKIPDNVIGIVRVHSDRQNTRGQGGTLMSTILTRL